MVSAGDARGGAAAPPQSRELRVALGLVLLGVFVVAVLPVVLDLSRPSGLYGSTQYDDGVYFAAALRLVSGVLPYRDFVFVQPPGITVLLAPFALLTHLVGARHALGLARIATALVVGCTAAMLTLALRHRGLFAGAVAGGLFALYPTAYAADHTFLLEPFLDFFCVLGIILVFGDGAVGGPRRLLLGGAAFGVAASIKTFAVVPIAVLLIVVALRNRRDAARLLIGVAAAVAVLVGPFLLAAPHAFWHDVVSSQLGRSTVRPTPFDNRVYAITGLAYSSSTLHVAGTTTLVAGALVAALVTGGIALALFRRASALEWFALFSAVAVTAMMFVPAQYFDHYALFSAAFLALALGFVAGRAGDAARSLVGRAGAEARRRLVLLGTVAVVVLGTLGSVLVLRSDSAYQKVIVDVFTDPGPSIVATVPAGTCVLSDAETVLVSAGRAGAGPPGCPAIVDATGTWLSYESAHPPVKSGAGPKDPALVALWQSAFGRADYVVLSGICAFRIPWTPSLYAWFDSHYSRAPGPFGLAFRHVAPRSAAEDPDLESRCAATRAGER